MLFSCFPEVTLFAAPLRIINFCSDPSGLPLALVQQRERQHWAHLSAAQLLQSPLFTGRWFNPCSSPLHNSRTVLCIVWCSVTGWWLHPHILPTSACPSSQQGLMCLLMDPRHLARDKHAFSSTLRRGNIHKSFLVAPKLNQLLLKKRHLCSLSHKISLISSLMSTKSLIISPGCTNFGETCL